MKLKKRKIFFLLTLLASSLGTVHAQLNNEKANSVFVDQGAVMPNQESKTAELIAANAMMLDSKTALQLLKEKNGIKVSIKRTKIGKKDLKDAELAKLLKRSTVVFATAFDCGHCPDTHIDPASGYVIDEDGIIVTNYHVVKAFTTTSRRNLAMTIQTSNGEVFPVIDILSSDEDNDLCILRVDTKGKKLNALPIGETAKQGDAIFVMSHPFHMFYYFSKGIVARNYTESISMKGQEKRPVMDITADYAGGSSGGPIVDIRGNLVATVSSTVSIYYSPTEQKNLQMVVKKTKPVICLKEMVKLF